MLLSESLASLITVFRMIDEILSRQLTHDRPYMIVSNNAKLFAQ